MNLLEFRQAQKTDWLLTDDDCCQLRRTDALAISNIFELYQINRYPGHLRRPTQSEDFFKVAHAYIDISDYSEGDILSALQGFGYESLDRFVEETSPDWNVIYKEDGTIDRENSPSYIIDFGLIAEMLFEFDALEYAIEKEYNSYNEAVSAIEQWTGENFSYAKQAPQSTSIAERIQDAARRCDAVAQESQTSPEKGGNKHGR